MYSAGSGTPASFKRTINESLPLKQKIQNQVINENLVICNVLKKVPQQILGINTSLC